MITRSNMAEQLREYQIRSKHDWGSFSLLSSTPNPTSSRAEFAMFVVWELVILAFFVFSAISFYLSHFKLAVILLCMTLLLLSSLKVTKQAMLAWEKKRRMLLPLSM